MRRGPKTMSPAVKPCRKLPGPAGRLTRIARIAPNRCCQPSADIQFQSDPEPLDRARRPSTSLTSPRFDVYRWPPASPEECKGRREELNNRAKNQILRCVHMPMFTE